MTIRWDGTALPCCYDLRGEAPLGKFPENSLKEIWEGRAYTSLRQDHLSGRINDIALCRGCLGNKKQPILEYILGEAAHLYRCKAK